MAGFKSWEEPPSSELLYDLAKKNATKLLWFLEGKYKPHVYQQVFHGYRLDNGLLPQFRHLVAGRRGGKTYSAAEDTAYYMLHPEQWWLDFHGKDNDEPLWAWILTKNYPEGFPSMREFLQVLKRHGLNAGLDFRYHKGEKYVEFQNGSFLQFKTADDPDSLRGAGLNILWMDEAAFIPNEEAYNVVFPALTDKKGCIVSTTTPKGKNWFYKEFFEGDRYDDPDQVAVEYRSIDNPYLDQNVIDRARRRYHPQLFKQEYMARFDAFQGVELAGEWLSYYNLSDLPKKDGKLKLKTYVGVDPAISLADTADRFAMALIGITEDHTQAYLLDLYAGRIPFPEQVEKIRQWHIKYRPQAIGIETTAYQAALAQQSMRLANFPPIGEIPAKGKKKERIMAMAPYFQLQRIKIHKSHTDFINEWLNYDSTMRNPEDDTLDAVEIALRTAGILLPIEIGKDAFQFLEERPAQDVQELAQRDLARIGVREVPYDDEMGEDW